MRTDAIATKTASLQVEWHQEIDLITAKKAEHHAGLEHSTNRRQRQKFLRPLFQEGERCFELGFEFCRFCRKNG